MLCTNAINLNIKLRYKNDTKISLILVMYL